MVVINFATLEGFIAYLKENGIRRYGIVAYSTVKMGEKGSGIYREHFRLSSVRYLDAKSVAHEILRCDIPYYRSNFVTEEYNSKKAKKPKEKKLQAVQEKIKELTEGFDLQLLDCEFQES